MEKLLSNPKKRKRQIINALSEKPVNANELTGLVDGSLATIMRDIASLKGADLVIFEGSPKTGVYTLTDKCQQLLNQSD